MTLTPHLWLYLVGAAISVAFAGRAALHDIRHHRLPNPLVGAAAGAGWVTVFALYGTGADSLGLVDPFIAAGLFAGPVTVAWIVAPAGIGGGDVKLLAALSPLLAWPNPWIAFTGLVIVFSAAVPEAVIRRRCDAGSTVALGPYIVGGAIVTAATSFGVGA